MKNTLIPRPAADEYNEFYKGYVAQAQSENIVGELGAQVSALETIYTSVSEEKGLYAYADGKWTLKEVLGHLIDGERVFSYRVLRISRGDQTPLAGFDENEYVAGSNFNERKIAAMLEEFALLRRSNVLLLESLPEAAWRKRGIASGFEITVRALAYIMFGHVAHHANVLRERYLN